MNSHLVPVSTLTRCFISSEFISNVTVTAIESDEKNQTLNLEKKYLLESKEGISKPILWHVGKEITFFKEKKGYYPIVTGTIDVPEDGIHHPNPFKNITTQQPSHLAVYCFAFAMNSPLKSNGKVQGVALTITPPKKLLTDCPHGEEGVEAKLTFENIELQKRWEKLSNQSLTLRKRNTTFNYFSNSLSFAVGIYFYYKTKKIIGALLTGIASKTLTSIFVWKYLSYTIIPFYWGVWQRGYLKNYTNPFITHLTKTSKDGGVFFNMRDLELPKEGAKFYVEAFKEGCQFSTVKGYVFPDKLTIFSPPYTIRKLGDAPENQQLIEEKGRPIRLLQSLSMGTLAMMLCYLKNKNSIYSVTTGLFVMIVSLQILHRKYERNSMNVHKSQRTFP